MEQLLKDNGYNYLRTLNGGFVAYYNAAEKAAYILHPAQLDGKPVLEIQTFLVELPGGAGSAPRLKAAKKENLFERRARIVETISRHLQKTRLLQSRR